MAGSGALGVRASDAPATRRWLRRRFIAAVAGVLMGVGLVIAALVVRAQAPEPVPVGPGSRAAVATIAKLRVVPDGRLGSTEELTVHFRTEDGANQTARIDIGVPEPQYQTGGTVPVVYQVDTPSQAMLQGVSDRPLLPWLLPIVLGAVALAAGAILLIRSLATTRVLRNNPWVMARATLVEAAASPATLRPIARFVELDGAPDSGPVLAGPLSARLVPDLIPDAWVAGSDRRFVVAATGGAPLASTHRAKPRPMASSERRTVRKPQPSV